MPTSSKRKRRITLYSNQLPAPSGQVSFSRCYEKRNNHAFLRVPEHEDDKET